SPANHAGRILHHVPTDADAIANRIDVGRAEMSRDKNGIKECLCTVAGSRPSLAAVHAGSLPPLRRSHLRKRLAATVSPWLVVGLAIGTVLVCTPQALAVNNCMQDKVGTTLNCTANDVRIARFNVLNGVTE